MNQMQQMMELPPIHSQLTHPQLVSATVAHIVNDQDVSHPMGDTSFLTVILVFFIKKPLKTLVGTSGYGGRETKPL